MELPLEAVGEESVLQTLVVGTESLLQTLSSSFSNLLFPAQVAEASMDESAEADPSDDDNDDDIPKMSSVMASCSAVHQKLSSWLAEHYQIALLTSFQTSKEVRQCTLEVATDATPVEDSIPVQEMKIRSSTARPILAFDRDVNAARNIFQKNMGLLV